MKKLTLSLALAGLFALTAIASADSPFGYKTEPYRFSQIAVTPNVPTSVTPGSLWSATEWFSVKFKPASVVTYTLKQTPITLVKKTYIICLDSFLGVQDANQAPLGGFALAYHSTPWQGWSWTVGIGLGSDGVKVRPGATVGLGVQF